MQFIFLITISTSEYSFINLCDNQDNRDCQLEFSVLNDFLFFTSVIAPMLEFFGMNQEGSVSNKNQKKSPIPLYFERIGNNECVPSLTPLPSNELIFGAKYDRTIIKNNICCVKKDKKETLFEFLKKSKKKQLITFVYIIDMINGMEVKMATSPGKVVMCFFHSK